MRKELDMDIVQHIATSILVGLGLSVGHAVIMLFCAMLDPFRAYAALTALGAISYVAWG